MVSVVKVDDIEDPRNGDEIGFGGLRDDVFYDVSVGFYIGEEMRTMRQGRGDAHYIRNMVALMWSGEDQTIFVREF